MATKLNRMKAAHRRRKMRVRKRVNGTSARPRMVVNRTLKYTSVSLVDDTRGVTLMGVTTKTLDVSGIDLPKDAEKFEIKGKKLPLTDRVADAYRLGVAVAGKAKEKGIKSVVFDRNGLLYHGRVRAVAEGARKGGLEL